MKKSPKEVTLNQLAKSIDSLAIAFKNGFDEMDKKLGGFGKKLEDFREEVHSEFDHLHRVQTSFDKTLQILTADMRDLKTSVGPLARLAGMQDREISELKHRLEKVERKVGISR